MIGESGGRFSKCEVESLLGSSSLLSPTKFTKMAQCINRACKNKLKKGQTKYCSSECRTAYKTRKITRHKRSDDELLEAGITGRGQFDYEGNL